MRLLGCIATLMAGVGTLLAQTNAPEARTLTLADCIELAIQNNLDVQIERLNPDIARYALGAARGAYDPVLNLEGDHSYSRSPGGFDAQGRQYSGTESDANSFSGGLSGILPWGTTYSLGARVTDTYGTIPGAMQGDPFVITNSFVDINSGNTVSFLSTNYTPIATREPFNSVNGGVGLFQLRQPLLRNFLIDGTRLQILINRRNVQISELQLKDRVMTTITRVEQAYYDLIFAQENVRVQQMALALAERLLAENRKRVEVGALAPLDEKQAEAQTAASRADLLGAQINEDTLQRVLKILLSDDYDEWKNVRIEPGEALIAVPQEFDLQESWRRGLMERPDLLQMRLSLEKQGYVVRFQKNQILPQLDVVGSAGLNASSREDLDDAWQQVKGRDNPFWSVGGQLSIPLGNRSARNNYQSAKATREQIVLQLKQLQQQILVQIENAIATARTSFQRAQATREARIYAEAALEAEQKKLESGKSTSFEVLRLQRDLTTARSAEIRALADYNVAVAQISLNEGSTLERRRISMTLE